jgi:transcriptional regulator with XRE-family HTH domain
MALRQGTGAGKHEERTAPTLSKRRLDQATFQALQALIAHGQLSVSERLALAIRRRRESLDLELKDLAERCGVEVMEIRDIEAAACTLSAPMLVQLSQVLEVDLVWFIEHEPAFFAKATVSRPLDTQGAGLDPGEGLQLIQAFAMIKDPAARKAVLKLAQQLARGEGPDGEPTNSGD